VKWPLDVLKGVYSEALASPQGNREVANAKLRNVVEKVFRYPESVMQGCAVASRIVRGLMEMEAREIYVVKKLDSETLEKITRAILKHPEIFEGVLEIISPTTEGKARYQTGKVGELLIYEKSNDILTEFSKVTGISTDDIEIEYTEGLAGKPDFLIKAKHDITINGKTFEKGDVIAIVEVKSAVLVKIGRRMYTPQSLNDMMNEAKRELNRHIKDFSKAEYGVAIAHAFDPELIILDEPQPIRVGNFDNPFIKVFKREDLGG